MGLNTGHWYQTISITISIKPTIMPKYIHAQIQTYIDAHILRTTCIHTDLHGYNYYTIIIANYIIGCSMNNCAYVQIAHDQMVIVICITSLDTSMSNGPGLNDCPLCFGCLDWGLTATTWDDTRQWCQTTVLGWDCKIWWYVDAIQRWRLGCRDPPVTVEIKWAIGGHCMGHGLCQCRCFPWWVEANQSTTIITQELCTLAGGWSNPPLTVIISMLV